MKCCSFHNIICIFKSNELPTITHDVPVCLHFPSSKTNSPKDWALFRNLRKCVHSQLNKAYRNYINCLLDPEQDKNNKIFWWYVKSKRQDNFGVSTLKGNGKVATDQKTKAEMLNNQLSSVFTKENTSNLPDKGRSTFPSMPDINITPTGVSKLLSNLNPLKAAGPDEIPARVLKYTANSISSILSHIFQQCINTGVVPSDWRMANIAPIFKKGDRSKPSNYRPVFLNVNNQQNSRKS